MNIGSVANNTTTASTPAPAAGSGLMVSLHSMQSLPHLRSSLPPAEDMKYAYVQQCLSDFRDTLLLGRRWLLQGREGKNVKTMMDLEKNVFGTSSGLDSGSNHRTASKRDNNCDFPRALDGGATGREDVLLLASSLYPENSHGEKCSSDISNEVIRNQVQREMLTYYRNLLAKSRNRNDAVTEEVSSDEEGEEEEDEETYKSTEQTVSKADEMVLLTTVNSYVSHYQEVLRKDMTLLAQHLALPFTLLRRRQLFLLLEESHVLTLGARLARYRVMLGRGEEKGRKKFRFSQEEAERLVRQLLGVLCAAWRQRERLWGCYRFLSSFSALGRTPHLRLPPLEISKEARLPPSVNSSATWRCRWERRHLLGPSLPSVSNNNNTANSHVGNMKEEDTLAFGPLTAADVYVHTESRQYVLAHPLAAAFRGMSCSSSTSSSSAPLFTFQANNKYNYKYTDQQTSHHSHNSAASAKKNEEFPLFDPSVETVQKVLSVPHMSPQIYEEWILSTIGTNSNNTKSSPSFTPVHHFTDDVWNITVLFLEFLLSGMDLYGNNPTRHNNPICHLSSLRRLNDAVIHEGVNGSDQPRTASVLADILALLSRVVIDLGKEGQQDNENCKDGEEQTQVKFLSKTSCYNFLYATLHQIHLILGEYFEILDSCSVSGTLAEHEIIEKPGDEDEEGKQQKSTKRPQRELIFENVLLNHDIFQENNSNSSSKAVEKEPIPKQLAVELLQYMYSGETQREWFLSSAAVLLWKGLSPSREGRWCYFTRLRSDGLDALFTHLNHADSSFSCNDIHDEKMVCSVGTPSAFRSLSSTPLRDNININGSNNNNNKVFYKNTALSSRSSFGQLDFNTNDLTIITNNNTGNNNKGVMSVSIPNSPFLGNLTTFGSVQTLINNNNSHNTKMREKLAAKMEQTLQRLRTSLLLPIVANTTSGTYIEKLERHLWLGQEQEQEGENEERKENDDEKMLLGANAEVGSAMKMLQFWSLLTRWQRAAERAATVQSKSVGDGIAFVGIVQLISEELQTSAKMSTKKSLKRNKDNNKIEEDGNSHSKREESDDENETEKTETLLLNNLFLKTLVHHDQLNSLSERYGGDNISLAHAPYVFLPLGRFISTLRQSLQTLQSELASGNDGKGLRNYLQYIVSVEDVRRNTAALANNTTNHSRKEEGTDSKQEFSLEKEVKSHVSLEVDLLFDSQMKLVTQIRNYLLHLSAMQITALPEQERRKEKDGNVDAATLLQHYKSTQLQKFLAQLHKEKNKPNSNSSVCKSNWAPLLIPTTLRGEVWGVLLEVPNSRCREYYYHGCDPTRALNPHLASVADGQLLADLPRCHPYHHVLGSREGSERLRGILRRWLQWRPTMSYWQGLDSITAVLLSVSPTDDTLVFFQLDALVRHYIPLGEETAMTLSGMRRRRMEELLRCLRRLLYYCDPLLAHHLFVRLHLEPQMFAVPWFLTLFANRYPLKRVLPLWDFLLLHSSNSYPLPLVALAVMTLVQHRVQLWAEDGAGSLGLLNTAGNVPVGSLLLQSQLLLAHLPPSLRFLSEELQENAKDARQADEDEEEKDTLNAINFMSAELLADAIKRQNSPIALEQCDKWEWLRSGVFLIDLRDKIGAAEKSFDHVLGSVHIPLNCSQQMTDGDTMEARVEATAFQIIKGIQDTALSLIPPSSTLPLLIDALSANPSSNAEKMNENEKERACDEDTTPTVSHMYAEEVIEHTTVNPFLLKSISSPHVVLMMEGVSCPSEEQHQLTTNGEDASELQIVHRLAITLAQYGVPNVSVLSGGYQALKKMCPQMVVSTE